MFFGENKTKNILTKFMTFPDIFLNLQEHIKPDLKMNEHEIIT